MAKTINRIGFGQVEPNHLSAQRTGQIYAQLPAKSDIKILEQGQFVKYDYANKEVNFTGVGEWMLVYNEEKLYEDRQGHKDFALEAKNYTEEVMTPRVFKTNVGDIYTTNTLYKANTGANATALTSTEVTGGTLDLEEGDLLKVDTTGYLVKETADIATSTEPMLWEIATIYTMPDGQDAVKIMRVK